MDSLSFLKRKFEQGKLAHAYLLVGSDTEASKSLAKKCVQLIHCKKKDPCGTCYSCRAIEKEQFSDLFFLKREEDKNEITLGQIKQLQNFLRLTAQHGTWKAVIIEAAEHVNQEAQNRLLKTLEEPPGKAVIFLTTPKPDFLLNTVVSRCQTIRLTQPASWGSRQREDSLQKFLVAANGMLAEKFGYAKAVDDEESNIETIFIEAEAHFRNLLLQNIGIQSKRFIKSHEHATMKQYSTSEIKHVLKTIAALQQKFLTTNINKRLALEILLMEIP